MKYIKEFNIFEKLDTNSNINNILDNMGDYLQEIFDKYDIPKSVSISKHQYKYWAFQEFGKLGGIDIENLTWSEQRDIHDDLKVIKDSLERFIGMKVNLYPESYHDSVTRRYSIKIRIIKKLEKWE